MSGSYSAGAATTSVSTLVNTHFTYLDVGVNLGITPKVHSREELSLHFGLDVSQVKAEINLGGFNEPEISQKKISADVRLREAKSVLSAASFSRPTARELPVFPALPHSRSSGDCSAGRTWKTTAPNW